MKAKLALFILGGLTTLTTAYLIWPELFGLCTPRISIYGPVCSSPYGYPYGVLLFPFSLSFLISTIPAFFTTRTTFRRWAWFTLWYGIVAAVLMYLAARAGIDDGGFISIPLFDIEKVAYLLAGIYILISLPLLGISDLLVRRKR